VFPAVLRRGGRGIAVLAGVLSVAWLVLPSGAGADSAPVSGGSWFWAGQPDPLPPPVGQPAGPLPAPDVPKTDFPVAAKAGQVDKESYLHIETTTIPAGSTVPAFTLTLKEDPAGTNANNASAKIRLMAVKDFWADGVTGAPVSQAPAIDDKAPQSIGTRAADGTWTFDLTALVAMWVGGTLPNNGVALQPVTDPGATFEVVWFGGGAAAPSTAGTFTPPAASTDTTIGGATDTVASAAPVPIEPSPSASIVAPDTPYNPLPARPATTVAPATSKTNRSRVIVAHPKRGAPPAFYLAGVAVIALIGLGAVALGDLGEPTPTRRGAVLRALEQRRALKEETS
jgi:hypothetical protein